LGHKSHTIFSSGKEWKSKEAEVAFVVDASMRGNILKFTPIDGRLCSVWVRTKFFSLTIINAYAQQKTKMN
jgi:hypothetical protein